jgi:hypothetical protein
MALVLLQMIMRMVYTNMDYHEAWYFVYIWDTSMPMGGE